jgi:hypothetical protein
MLNPELEFEFQLAETLGKSRAELIDIGTEEFTRWVAYFKRKAKRDADAAKKNKVRRPRR